MSYTISKKMINEIERAIIDQKLHSIGSVNAFKKEVYYPFRYFKSGFSILYRDINKALMGTFIFSIFVFWILFRIDADEALKSVMGSTVETYFYPYALLLPLLVTMFSMPSSYCFSNVSKIHIDFVRKKLEGHGIVSIEELRPIRECIVLCESRTKLRTVSFRVLIALCWTYVTHRTDLLFQQTGHVNAEEIRTFTSMLVALLFFYVIVESYAKANSLLFQTALFGCSEYESTLLRTRDTNTHPG